MSQKRLSPTTGKRIGGGLRCPTLKSAASGSGSGGGVPGVGPWDGEVVVVDEHEVVVVVVDDGIVVDEVVGVAVDGHGAVVVVEDGVVVDVVVGADVVVEVGLVVLVVDDGTVVVVVVGADVVVEVGIVVVVVDSSAAPAVPGTRSKVSTRATTTPRLPKGTAPWEAAWNTPPLLTFLLRA